MANSLLDFVISLVRDPEAAARYAANPAQAIANAHLTGVTSADVNNLIPVVSDSVSMTGLTGLTGGATGMPATDHGNVWASGAATAAFDAFTPHPPAGVDHQPSPVSGVIQQPHAPQPTEVPAGVQPVGISNHEPAVLISGAEVPDAVFDHGGFPPSDPGIWDQSVIHPHGDSHPVDHDHHGLGLHD